MTAYARWLQKERGLRFDGYHDLWQWSVDDIEAFWASIWDFFEVKAERPYKRVLGRREMPGAEWFPGARLSYAEHIFRDRDDDGRRDDPRVRDARPRRGHLGRAARAGRRHRGRAARAGRRARRSRRRLPAEHPRDDRDLPRVREHRRDLVVLLAGLRHPLAWSTASRRSSRRCSSRRTATATAARTSTATTRSRSCRASSRRSQRHGPRALPRSGGDDRRRASTLPDMQREGELDVRAAAVRASAVGPVLVRHHGAAEGDRPRPGRRAARAPEGPAACRPTSRPTTASSGSRRPAG